jgi:hypothetical protein
MVLLLGQGQDLEANVLGPEEFGGWLDVAGNGNIGHLRLGGQAIEAPTDERVGKQIGSS